MSLGLGSKEGKGVSMPGWVLRLILQRTTNFSEWMTHAALRKLSDQYKIPEATAALEHYENVARLEAEAEQDAKI